MQKCLADSEESSAEEKTFTEKFYLKSFVSVMQKMADELAEARFKYESLEKERFKY